MLVKKRHQSAEENSTQMMLVKPEDAGKNNLLNTMLIYFDTMFVKIM